jgi:hypothetical protein
MHVKIFGIPFVIGFFALAFASYLGFLPPWVFLVGICGEIVIGSFSLWKIHSLKNPKRG